MAAVVLLSWVVGHGSGDMGSASRLCVADGRGRAIQADGGAEVGMAAVGQRSGGGRWVIGVQTLVRARSRCRREEDEV